ncbi:MAG: DUF1697 domain-containing protein [Hyphomicrobiales bacterium]|nr:MAG: DUF1697 domain-containing protein [Hyphomicrobiales bacterium]
MARHVILLRGINVGGKNKLAMAALKACLEELGYTGISTYIASGNVVMSSAKGARAIEREIETALGERFKLDSELIRVLALPATKFNAVIKDRPKEFGDEPGKYHSDAIFLMGLSVAEAVQAFEPREGVDTLWPGKGLIYHQRLSAKRTQTRLNKMMANPAYKSMTIRSWQTVEKLAEMLDA